MQDPQAVGVVATQREVFTMYDGWRQMEGARRKVLKHVVGIRR
jgi:hypothetical protein